MHKLHLIPECYAETTMVKLLFQDADLFNHASGISQVSKILSQKDKIDYKNIGFIDNDKHNVPQYFDEFQLLYSFENVALKKHPETNDFLVVVNPAIEKFLLSQLGVIKKQPSEFGLPNDFNNFRKELKRGHIQYHEGYKKMIVELKDKRAPGVQFIIDSINSLKVSN